jgi:hypothetical protein
VPADRLALARPLPPATGAELRLWTLPAAAPAADPEADAETERRLRALGYLN